MKNDHIWELLARKMSGEASPEELRALEEILQKDAHLHFSIQAITKLWRNFNTPATIIESKKAYTKHLDKMRREGMLIDSQNSSEENETVLLEGSRRTPFQRKLRCWSLITCCLIIAGGIAWHVLKPANAEPDAIVSSKGSNSEVSTKYGSKTRIQLPDGSQVWLNAGSKLNYKNDFGNENRQVELIGEGFFDVVKNRQKPFIIHTSSIDIKVIGTQFNVKSYPGDKTSETSLVRGSVEVIVRKRPNEKYILKPNEKIVVLNDNESEEKKPAEAVKFKENKEPIIAIKKLTYKIGDSIAIETAWAYNKLIFEDESFAEVAKKLERWYDVHFEFRSSKLEDIRLNGSFINETLPQAMEALKYTNRFHYEIEGKKIIIY